MIDGGGLKKTKTYSKVYQKKVVVLRGVFNKRKNVV